MKPLHVPKKRNGLSRAPNVGSELTASIKILRKPEHIISFLSDLLTRSEIVSLNKRLLTATWMRYGASYRQLSLATGLSSKSLARISKMIRNHDSAVNQTIEKLYPNGYSFVKYGLD